jgi:hypothetical protein
LEGYLHATYVVQGARVADIERALGASFEAIRRHLERAGIAVRHQRDRRRKAG